MSKTAMIRARVDPSLKGVAEGIFDAIGLSVTDAITLFYKQVEMRRGLPFDVVIPNARTRRTMAETDEGRNLVKSKDADEMFKKLGI